MRKLGTGLSVEKERQLEVALLSGNILVDSWDAPEHWWFACCEVAPDDLAVWRGVRVFAVEEVGREDAGV